MAGTNDSRASSFNADEFRDAIIFAMSMGLPEATADRPSFRWKVSYEHTVEDRSGNPYDFSDVPTKTISKDDVQIPVAVEFVSQRGSEGTGTSLGEFDRTHVVLTILDEHYGDVDDADEVILGGNTYEIKYTEPPMGLFDVTVYRMHALASDES